MLTLTSTKANMIKNSNRGKEKDFDRANQQLLTHSLTLVPLWQPILTYTLKQHASKELSQNLCNSIFAFPH